jgi:hypothetical protein
MDRYHPSRRDFDGTIKLFVYALESFIESYVHFYVVLLRTKNTESGLKKLHKINLSSPIFNEKAA